MKLESGCAAPNVRNWLTVSSLIFDFGGITPGRGRYFGHTGGAPGIGGAFYHFLDSGYTVAVLATGDPGTTEALSYLQYIDCPTIRHRAAQSRMPSDATDLP